METRLQQLTNPTEEEFLRLKEETARAARQQRRFWYKHSPFAASRRKLMKRMQDCGYNDIFIPNMLLLSPSYKEYHDALTEVNERICLELGLYHDTKYNIVANKLD